MKFNELDSSSALTKTVFQRKNGVLKALKVSVENKEYSEIQHPMFPIVKDRDEKHT